MTFSNRGSFGGNRGQNSGNRGGFGGRSFDRPTMYDAVCAKCGVDCQVPFKPNGRKEIFCSKCFESNGGGESRDSRGFGDSRSFGDSRGSGDSRGFRDSRGPGRFERRDNVDTYFAEKQMFSAVCDECGDNCKVPFQPRNGKPVLCSNCFAGKNEGRGEGRQDYNPRPNRGSGVDLEAINAKLDRIIKLLSPKETNELKETKEIKKPKDVKESKEITEKILEEIQVGTEKKLSSGKKKPKAKAKSSKKE